MHTGSRLRISRCWQILLGSQRPRRGSSWTVSCSVPPVGSRRNRRNRRNQLRQILSTGNSRYTVGRVYRNLQELERAFKTKWWLPGASRKNSINGLTAGLRLVVQATSTRHFRQVAMDWINRLKPHFAGRMFNHVKPCHVKALCGLCETESLGLKTQCLAESSSAAPNLYLHSKNPNPLMRQNSTIQDKCKHRSILCSEVAGRYCSWTRHDQTMSISRLLIR